MSDEARANIGGLYGALWEEYKANVSRARPRLQLARVTGDPAAWIASSGGDMAEAALAAGMVDKLGDKVQFGARVAELAGKDPWSEKPGSYAASDLTAYLADMGQEAAARKSASSPSPARSSMGMPDRESPGARASPTCSTRRSTMILPASWCGWIRQAVR